MNNIEMQEAHRRAAEHHELAAKAHRTAAEHNEKGEYEKGALACGTSARIFVASL